MSYSISITNRLNWIDLAKTLAISFVVFGHIPEEKDSFLRNYIILFHMPLFFFISGYLTKIEYFSSSTLKKYWHSLIIPYFCYNIIFYPYWVVKHFIRFPGGQWFDYIKPFIGTLMFQIETPISSYLNGVTWFIAALIVMKIILSTCNKYRYGRGLLLLLVLAAAIFFIINEKYRFTTGLTTVGFLKCFPFFILGHLCKQNKWLTEQKQQKDVYICIGGILLSLITFTIGREHQAIINYGISFWIVCLTAISGILSLCKVLDKVELEIIKNISLGTIVIMGLHWILIGTTNIVFEKMMHIEGIMYPLWGAIALTIIFLIILYPIIIIFKKKYPFMLGKWKPA